MPTNYYSCAAAAVLPLLIYASYTDIKKREVPIWGFFAEIPLLIFLLHHYNTSIGWHLFYATVITLIFLFAAIFGGGGGGDVIMMGVISLAFGPLAIWATLFSSIPSAGYYMITKIKQEKESKEITVPFAPMIFFGVVLTLIIYTKGGN